MNKFRIVIADNSDLSRIGLRTIFAQNEQIDIVGEACTGDQLIELVSVLIPDVVMIDYTAKGFTIETVGICKKIQPTLRFVAITPLQSRETLINAIKNGINSYIKKDCDEQEILESIPATAKGDTFFCGRILETIQRNDINIDHIEFEQLSCLPVSLSQREIEIIQQIAEGKTNASIADSLFISTHTVNTHRKNIMAKLGVNNTAAMVMYAVKYRLVSPSEFTFSTSPYLKGQSSNYFTSAQ
jgi:DNA-binding NarL/FixJ family response regulator